jgi:hypothetical protein
LQVFRGDAKNGLPSGIGPLEIAIAVASGTTGGDPNPPSVSTFTEATSAIVIAGTTTRATSPMTLTAPTNYTTNALNAQGTDAFSVTTGLAYRLTGAGDPEDPGVFTDNGVGGAWCAATLVLKEAVSVVQLVVADAAVGIAADNIDLTQHNVLAVQDAAVAIAADNIVLEGVPIALVVQDAAVAIASDNLALTQHNVLAVQDATVAIASDNIALTQHNALVVQDATVGIEAENVTLGAAPPENEDQYSGSMQRQRRGVPR